MSAVFAIAISSACTMASPAEEVVIAVEAGEAGETSAEPERLSFTSQSGWIESEPASSMRAAEFVLPGSGGAVDASLVVYYFGSQRGGTVEANVTRWTKQFDQPDGRPSEEVMQRVERMVLGFPTHEVYLSGTYVAETSPGSGEYLNHPEWRMMSAIIESDHGFYYVKLIGPEQTVRRWELSFRTFLNAVR